MQIIALLFKLYVKVIWNIINEDIKICQMHLEFLIQIEFYRTIVIVTFCYYNERRMTIIVINKEKVKRTFIYLCGEVI